MAKVREDSMNEETIFDEAIDAGAAVGDGDAETIKMGRKLKHWARGRLI